MLNNESKYDQTKLDPPVSHVQQHMNPNNPNSFGQQSGDTVYFPCGTTPGERIPSIKRLTDSKSFGGSPNSFSVLSKSDSGAVNSAEMRNFDSSVGSNNNNGLHDDDIAMSGSLFPSNEDYAEDEDGEDEDDGIQLPIGNESTGRWTRNEHEMFLEALKKYGKEWKKVASMVRTRTVVQTRTHAQKYFQKVTKTLGCVGICGSDDDGEASACSDIKRGMSLSSKKGRRSFLGSSPDLSAGYPSEISSSMTIAYNPTSSVIKPSALTDGNTPTVKDHFHSSREYMIDEDSIGRDSLVLSELMNMTPNTSGVQSGNSGSLLGLSIPLPPPPFLSLPNREALGFPQPSPAACGKRKHAELQAAQMLAASSVFEIDATDAFLMVKEDSSVGHKRPTGLTLTISNPEVSSDNGGAFFGPPPDSTPGTPWAKDLKALEARGCKTQQSAVPVITPSEQRNFLTKVRLLVQVADLSGLREILNAAEFSAQSFLTSNSGAIGDPASLVSVSNMMTAFTTPLPPDFGGIPRTGSPRAGGSNVISFRKTPGTSLVARSLNRSDKREKSVLMEAISLLDEVHDEAVVCELLSLLLVHGASASLTDSKNNTALHFAATKGLESVGRLLLNKGCPVNLQNSDGDAATHIAAQHGYGAFLEMLVDLGANFHLRNQHALCALDLAGHLSQVPGERAIIRRLMLAKEPRLRTLILYHDDCLAHTTCRSTDWEGPDRLVDIMKRLRDRQEFPEFELEISDQFEKASVVLLNRAHSPEYITFVNDLSTQLNADNSGALGECDFKAPLAMPFTPQIQRFVLNKTLEELKSSEICDTSFSPGTLSSARRAAGAVAHAVDCVLLGRNRNVFCVVRPPGHHAGYNGLLDGGYSCGFCIFNSVAAGALHALEEHNCERVAIIDLDIHHGNGTEDIVRRYPHPSRLFFFSLHLYDKEAQVQTSTGSVPGFQFYPGSGAADDTIHNIINVPIPPLWKDGDSTLLAAGANSQTVASFISSSSLLSTASFVPDVKLESGKIKISEDKTANLARLFGRDAYRQAIQQRLIPSLRAFNPDLIIMSSGFDAAAGDVGNCRNFPDMRCERGMDLSPEDFGWATSEVLKVADLCCAGKVVSVLEGGYGEYASSKMGGLCVKGPARTHTPATRHGTRNGAIPLVESPSASVLNRDVLSSAVVGHVQRLVDPYGPSRPASLSEGAARKT